MSSKLFTKIVLAAILSVGISRLASAQSPGDPGVANNTTGRPDAGDVNRGGKNATVIYANSDGGKEKNEFLYFKVYAPGNGSNWSNYDWYTNPTAWVSPYDFHFFRTNLRVYGNSIVFNNAPKSRRIIFDQDTWSTDDHQFTGLGSTDNNDLRYQVKDATKSHRFYAGTSSTGAKTLITVNGNGRLQLPKAGQLELGAGEAKEANAGTISYKMFSDGLDIVGAGTASNRVVKVWAESGTSFNGIVSIGSNKNWIHTVPPTKLTGGVNLSTYKLFVDGGVLAKEVRVNSQWADYVFKPDYRLRTLSEVEKNGLDVATTLKLQQEKIEELTLYIIDLKKMVDRMQTHPSVDTTPTAK